MLTDIYLLIIRNLTMSALCVAYGLALWQMPIMWILVAPGIVHISSALITNGDLQLRKTRPVKLAWLITAGMVAIVSIVVAYKVYIGPITLNDEADTFNYLDVLKFLFDWYAGVGLMVFVM